MDNGLLRTAVRSAYDLQQVRIQMGLRLVGNFKAKLGQEAGIKEKELSDKDRKLIEDLRKSYRRITDGVTKVNLKNFEGDELISTFTEYNLIKNYTVLDDQESQQFKLLEYELKNFPIYNEFLKGVKGCGTAMSGVILSEIDIHKAKYASSIWKYAGVDVAQDGKGRSNKKEHLIKVKYLDKKGKEQERNSITYNPFLKTKLLGVLGASFRMTAKEEKYAKAYYNYKNRMENHKVYKDTTKLHRHNMANRYSVKIFLIDLYENWRALENLVVHKPYAEAKLGIKHEG